MPSGKERGETDVFAGFILACYHDVGIAGPANSLRKLAPCKEIWSPESEKFLLVDTRILGFETRKTAQGIWNPTDDRIWYPSPTESGIHYLGTHAESIAWNPESKTVLDCLPWGENTVVWCCSPLQGTVKGGCIRRIVLERDSKQRKIGSRDPEGAMFLASIGVLHV